MTAVLVLWNDCAPDGREHYERWYAREHILERVDIPGFRFGRRFESDTVSPRFFTYYEVDTADVLSSPAYMERQQNPTPATTKAMASFRNMNRTVCDVAAVAGTLSGSHVVTLRLDEPLLDIAAARSYVPIVAQRDGVARVHLWTVAQLQTPGSTHEMMLRDRPDRSIASVLAIECIRQTDAEAITSDLRTQHPSALLTAGRSEIGIYNFLCSYEGRSR